MTRIASPANLTMSPSKAAMISMILSNTQLTLSVSFSAPAGPFFAVARGRGDIETETTAGICKSVQTQQRNRKLYKLSPSATLTELLGQGSKAGKVSKHDGPARSDCNRMRKRDGRCRVELRRADESQSYYQSHLVGNDVLCKKSFCRKRGTYFIRRSACRACLLTMSIGPLVCAIRCNADAADLVPADTLGEIPVATTWVVSCEWSCGFPFRRPRSRPVPPCPLSTSTSKARNSPPRTREDETGDGRTLFKRCDAAVPELLLSMLFLSILSFSVSCFFGFGLVCTAPAILRAAGSTFPAGGASSAAVREAHAPISTAAASVRRCRSALLEGRALCYHDLRRRRRCRRRRRHPPRRDGGARERQGRMASYNILLKKCDSNVAWRCTHPIFEVSERGAVM